MRQKEYQTMKVQQGFLAVFALVGIAIPALGQMSGMKDGGKMPAKSASAKATTKKTAMCCMSGMKMDMKMSGMSSTDKKKMGACCMSGMKSGGMKMGSMKSGKSPAEKKMMGSCCMAAMKSGDKKMEGHK